jgi:hypothetical protein
MYSLRERFRKVIISTENQCQSTAVCSDHWFMGAFQDVRHMDTGNRKGEGTDSITGTPVGRRIMAEDLPRNDLRIVDMVEGSLEKT